MIEGAKRLGRIGMRALEAGDTELAISALREAVEAAPNDGEAYAALGLAYAKALRPAEACQCLQRSIALAPDRIDVLCVLGELSLERQDFVTAAHCFERCLALDPKAEHPHGVRARGLVRKAQKLLAAKAKK